MTRERFVPRDSIDRDGMGLVTMGVATSGGGRATVTGIAGTTPGMASPPAKNGQCTIIYLPHTGPAGNNLRQTADPAPDSSTERATDWRSGGTRGYVEALVGWLLIFGAAYFALLLTGE